MRDARHQFIIVFGGERAIKQSMLRLLYATTAQRSSSVERAFVAVIIAVGEVLRLDLDGDAVLAMAEA